jgi:hypothetical protein
MPEARAPGAISVEPILVSKPAGTYSIAGVQAKVVAEQWAHSRDRRARPAKDHRP